MSVWWVKEAKPTGPGRAEIPLIGGRGLRYPKLVELASS